MATLRRRLLDAAMDKLGYHAVPKWEAQDWPEHQFAKKLFRYLDPDCVFDVGANVGQFGQLLRERGYEGQILSFEPVPQSYAALSKLAAADPKWEAFPFALGSAISTASINVMAGSDFSSFYTPKTDDLSSFDGSNTISETVEVEVKTIEAVYDELSAKFGFQRPFLKLDTQGFDLEVFKGAAAKAEKFVGILSEVAVRTIYHGAPVMAESLDAYSARGFDLVALYAVNPSRFGQLVEFNSFFARKDLLPKTAVEARSVS